MRTRLILAGLLATGMLLLPGSRSTATVTLAADCPSPRVTIAQLQRAFSSTPFALLSLPLAWRSISRRRETGRSPVAVRGSLA